jgi:hypothetical protein
MSVLSIFVLSAECVAHATAQVGLTGKQVLSGNALASLEVKLGLISDVFGVGKNELHLASFRQFTVRKPETLRSVQENCEW